MGKPDEVAIQNIATAPMIDVTGRVTQGTTYTYMVGRHGPFILSVSAIDDTPDNVNAIFAQKVANLRAVGADL